MIYHITSPEQWAEAKRLQFYECDSLHSEGFIHSSTYEQVMGVYQRYYSNTEDIVILCIDEAKLDAELKFERSTNNEMYPHIYGKLNVSAVVETKTLDFFKV